MRVLIILISAAVLAACVTVTGESGSYGFYAVPAKNLNGGTDGLFVGRVACSGPATGKLDAGDLIVKVNGLDFDSDGGITKNQLDWLAGLIALPVGDMVITVRKGGALGGKQTYRFAAGPTDWSLESCRPRGRVGIGLPSLGSLFLRVLTQKFAITSYSFCIRYLALVMHHLCGYLVSRGV